MRLKVLDQIAVTSVRSETLRPGDEIEVTAADGAVLLKTHPRAFAELGDTVSAKVAEAEPKRKAKVQKA